MHKPRGPRGRFDVPDALKPVVRASELALSGRRLRLFKNILHQRFALPDVETTQSKASQFDPDLEAAYHRYVHLLWTEDRAGLASTIRQLEESVTLREAAKILDLRPCGYLAKPAQYKVDRWGVAHRVITSEERYKSVEKEAARARILDCVVGMLKERVGNSAGLRDDTRYTTRATSTTDRANLRNVNNSSRCVSASSSSTSGDSVFSHGVSAGYPSLSPITTAQNSFNSSYGQPRKSFDDNSMPNSDLYPHSQVVHDLVQSLRLDVPSPSQSPSMSPLEPAHLPPASIQPLRQDKTRRPHGHNAAPQSMSTNHFPPPSNRTHMRIHTAQPCWLPEMPSMRLQNSPSDDEATEVDETDVLHSETEADVFSSEDGGILLGSQPDNSHNLIANPSNYMPGDANLHLNSNHNYGAGISLEHTQVQQTEDGDEMSDYSYGDSCDASLIAAVEDFELQENLGSASSPASGTQLQNRIFSLPFWAQYEATRIAIHYGIKYTEAASHVSTSPLFEELESACTSSDGIRWHRALDKHLKPGNGTKQPVEMLGSGMWAQLQRYGWSERVHMTGRIYHDYKSNWPRERPYSISLKVLGTDSSNRYVRKYGSDRFLTLDLPDMNDMALKRGLKSAFLQYKFPKLSEEESLKAVKDRLLDFLFEDGLELLGRTWKGFWVKEGERGLQLVMFATRGEGIPDIEVTEALFWHIPFNDTNLGSTVDKLASRIGLAFSGTTPTVCFSRDQICPNPSRPRSPHEPYAPDKDLRNWIDDIEGEVMDDGCSIASPAVFRAIQEKYGLEEAPSAFQGRIAGAKGLWIVCPVTLKQIRQGQADPNAFWIRINESQRKFIEHYCLEIDSAWTTLDVIRCSHPPEPAKLNRQLIPILEYRGVPYETIKELQDEHLDDIVENLKQSLADPATLRSWLYNVGGLSSRRAEEIPMLGSFPDNDYDKLVMLIDGGFRYEETYILRSYLATIIEDYWKAIRDKTHFQIQQSTTLFCVADPTCTLKEGEVSLHFSRGMTDKRTGCQITFVEGDILVARNPAYLPSDIQKVTAVYNENLRELKDVIVFSAQGLKSLASLLSGGDYDGDKAWICWDPRIVGPFRRECEELPPFNRDIWFDPPNKKRVRELASPNTSDSLLGKAFLRESASNALNGCTKQLLGKYSTIHARYTYQKGRGVGDPIAIELAHLCGVLVDASKQGLYLKKMHEKIFEARCRRLKGHQEEYRDDRELKPYYKADNAPWVDSDRPWHILDKLLLAARSKMDMEKAEIDKQLEQTSSIDDDLVDLFTKEEAIAKQEKGDLKACLDGLKLALDNVHKQWTDQFVPGMGLSSKQKEQARREGSLQLYESSFSGEETSSFSSTVSEIYALYKDITPLPEGTTTRHPTIQRWARDAERYDSEWELIKASCAYLRWVHRGSKGKHVWYMAGKQLCTLKARARAKAEGIWPVVGSIYWTLRSDKRILQKQRTTLANREDDSDSDYEHKR